MIFFETNNFCDLKKKIFIDRTTFDERYWTRVSKKNHLDKDKDYIIIFYLDSDKDG